MHGAVEVTTHPTSGHLSSAHWVISSALFGSPHKENRVHCNSDSLLDEGQKTWLCKQESQVLRISLGAALILDVVIL